MCRKDSAISREMINNHIGQKNDYMLELVGIAAHVYADTFAHYGFSGVSSRRNRIDGGSLHLTQSTSVMESVVGEKIAKWFEKYGIQGGLLKNIRATISGAAELATGALGHGGVSVYPDQPYLKWQFEYEYPSDSVPTLSERDNKETFLEGCMKLHIMFKNFVKLHPEHADILTEREFDVISPIVKEILAFEGDKNERAELWCKHAKSGYLLNRKESIPTYNSNDWQDQYNEFSLLTNPVDFARLNIYKFFQAASYHKHFVLRELLPKHGIIVI